MAQPSLGVQRYGTVTAPRLKAAILWAASFRRRVKGLDHLLDAAAGRLEHGGHGQVAPATTTLESREP
jgi:hypothetical protein